MIPHVSPLFSRAALPRLGAAFLSGFFLLGGVTLPAQASETWASTDIGAVGTAGSSSESDNVVSVRASGADIWGTADTFHFRSRTLTGDGTLVARVLATGGGDAWAKAGLMMREDLTPGARNVMALFTTGGSLGLQSRAAANEVTSYAENTRATAPVWLVLVREGNVFRAHRSFDGENWTTLGSVTLDLPETIHAGVAATSHDPAVLQTATLDYVMLMDTHPAPDTPPGPPADFKVYAPHTGAIQLEWWDGNTDESGFEIERAEEGGPFAVITTVANNTTAFVDYPPASFSLYRYRLRTVREGVYSTYTPELSCHAGPMPFAMAWNARDVGASGWAGSDSGYTGSEASVTLNAGGADIYEDADSFRFLAETAQADFTITARVASLANTHPWAKAGVMFRASLAPGSANVAMLLTPGNGAAFQARDLANHSTFHQGASAASVPGWVRLTRSGNTFTGYVSADGSAWTEVGSRTITLPGEIYVGMVATAHATVQTNATFDHIAASRGAPLSPTFAPEVMGSSVGEVSDNGGTTTIRAIGGDIYAGSDSGVFYQRGWTGDGTFIVKTSALNHTHDWAKAGIMLRASLGASAANTFVAITPTQGAVLQGRFGNGSSGYGTVTRGQYWTAFPGCWLKLVRGGGSIAASWSPEGINWYPIGSMEDWLPETIFVGLAVSSHNPTEAATTTFTSFTQE